jgi:hypothetical protein
MITIPEYLARRSAAAAERTAEAGPEPEAVAASAGHANAGSGRQSGVES